jgi:hypothetical protein
MRSIHLLSLAFVLGLAAACGGGGSGGDGDDGVSIPLEDIPAQYASAICSAYTNCLGDLFTIFRPGEDCVKNTTIQLQEELAGLPALVDAGRIAYHGTKLQACLDEVSGSDCSALIQRAPETCEAALEGTVAEGGDCELDEECKGAQYCKMVDSCPGTCTRLEQAGGVCSGNGDCVSGLICGETERCVAPAKAGEACKQGEPDCSAGYLCLGEDAAARTPGTCFEVESTFSGQAGDDCSLETKLCASGYACEITKFDPIGGTCAAVVGSGDACHAAFPDQCPADEFCLLDANPLEPFQGRCTPKPEAGEPCGKGLGPTPDQCAPYARCDAGVCREIAHLGEGCTVKSTCYSDRCIDGACVAANSCE